MKSLQFAKIRQKGLRLTKPRREILQVLLRITQPRSAQQIFAAVASRGVDRSSVFRTLKAFAEQNIVESTENARHERLYELRPVQQHHHLICNRCGRIETVRCFLPSRAIPAWEKRYGFRAVRHESRAYGLCRTCQEPMRS